MKKVRHNTYNAKKIMPRVSHVRGHLSQKNGPQALQWKKMMKLTEVVQKED